jgi:hypothetical protein
MHIHMQWLLEIYIQHARRDPELKVVRDAVTVFLLCLLVWSCDIIFSLFMCAQHYKHIKQVYCTCCMHFMLWLFYFQWADWFLEICLCVCNDSTYALNMIDLRIKISLFFTSIILIYNYGVVCYTVLRSVN